MTCQTWKPKRGTVSEKVVERHELDVRSRTVRACASVVRAAGPAEEDAVDPIPCLVVPEKDRRQPRSAVVSTRVTQV